MRSIFEENDVICVSSHSFSAFLEKLEDNNNTTFLLHSFQAEVRGFQHDGSLHLQARSQKYGKVYHDEDKYLFGIRFCIFNIWPTFRLCPWQDLVTSIAYINKVIFIRMNYNKISIRTDKNVNPTLFVCEEIIRQMFGDEEVVTCNVDDLIWIAPHFLITWYLCYFIFHIWCIFLLKLCLNSAKYHYIFM